MEFCNGEYYHIYNRGVEKRKVFMNDKDFSRFLESMREFNDVRPVGSLYQKSFLNNKNYSKEQSLVSIISYCLNPNHYHLLLRQEIDGGISEFMKRLGGGYTKYFNEQHDRSGALFQGKFKAKEVLSNAQLLYVNVYVEFNFMVHSLRRPTSKWVSSQDEWLENGKGFMGYKLCDKSIIFDQFKNNQEYLDFANDTLKSMIEKKENT